MLRVELVSDSVFCLYFGCELTRAAPWADLVPSHKSRCDASLAAAGAARIGLGWLHKEALKLGSVVRR